MISILAATADGFVYEFGTASVIMMAMQLFTLVITLGSLVLGVYIAVLLIKFLRRGIRLYDIQLDEYNSKDDSVEE